MTSNLTIQNNLLINSGKKFIVPSTNALTIFGAITNNGGNPGFLLQSDAAGTASLLHNTSGVPATVKRYISGVKEGWHFLSTPVSAQNITGPWIPSGTYGNGTGYDLYIWDEPSSCWIYKLNTTSATNWPLIHPQSYFIPGKGYLYAFQETNPTKQFDGNLNNGTVSYPVTNVSSDELLYGFNLVGNPYPSSIDWKAATGWTRSNLVVSGGGYDMWIWNPAASNYGVFNSINPSDVGTNSVSRYMAPMQGYFIRAATSGNIQTTNEVRTHQGAGNWFKNGAVNAQSLSLVVNSSSGYGFDEIMLEFGYPQNEDGAMKLFSKVATAPGLYLPANNNNLSVRYLTYPEKNPVVPVMFKPGSDGIYSLKCRFDPLDFETAMLEDRFSGYIQNLKSKPEYTFSATPGDDPARFILHFGPSEKQDNQTLPARIFVSNGQLAVDLTLIPMPTEVMVYDIPGKLILQRKLPGKMSHLLDLTLPTQLLFVYLKNEIGTRTQKIIWRNN